MRRSTRRKLRRWIIGLCAAAVLIAFVVVRLHHRADQPQTDPSTSTQSASTPHHTRHHRRHHRSGDPATADSAVATGRAATLKALEAAAPQGTSFQYGPGMHTYLSTVSGNGSLGWVGYKDLNGTRYAKQFPPDPYVKSARIQAPGVHVIVGGVVAPKGGSVTCTITVDGKTAVRRTVHGAYRMVVCEA
ncbi:hypothetical protein [Nocardioides terrisoli]|uniref:hypothetical protein n=1 Tax=Nocardioides terrisoli TaxID=3388267 RepID=UPI00287B852D|nr:hypothetical protein [Nocardioides marmorisolisilvae]